MKHLLLRSPLISRQTTCKSYCGKLEELEAERVSRSQACRGNGRTTHDHKTVLARGREHLTVQQEKLGTVAEADPTDDEEQINSADKDEETMVKCCGAIYKNSWFHLICAGLQAAPHSY
uniref:Uncharacterized protein n=1 Tax=Branchiostoma floridae TaxID=7739 RepID=C3ZAY8_BRAFL|eukprot:XP_002594014.1 hypothetical protein BRAFLDRAFT_68546 [Branchiostoma floridae]